MAKFIYRMQSILDIKEKLEEQARNEFAAARMHLNEEEEKLALLKGRKSSYEEQGRELQKSGLNVLDILTNRNAITRMQEFIEIQRDAVEAANMQLEKARIKLRTAMQESKTQEKLRERAFEEFIREENAREAKEVIKMERKKVMPLDEELGLDDAKLEKKRLKEEKKKLKAEQKEQKKLAKQRAREIDDREDELSEGEDASSGSVFAVTFVIVLIWIAILCLIIKLDFGGFGSNVLAPVLKDVPIINMILPSVSEEDTASPEQQEEYGGYSSLKDAVDYIKELELELERAQTSQTSNAEELAELKAQVERLKTFEDNQVDFQRVVTEFYEEVVYADKGPGIEEYRKYYEEMNPATAEYLYKQVIQQSEESKKISEYVESYSSMKPASAAAIFAQMTDNLDLVSRILGAMDSEKRGSILAAMDPELASRLTKMMDPES